MRICKAIITSLVLYSLFSIRYPLFSHAQDVPPEVIEAGLRFLDNPADFLFDLRSNIEDSVPVPSYRHAQIRFNFFPTFFPFAWAGLNLKIKLLNEKRIIPQIDIQGQYGQNLLVAAVADKMEKTSTDTLKSALYDYTVGLIFTKKFDSKTRLFFGPKFSHVNLQFKPDKPIEVGSFQLDELNIAASETFIFWGLEHQTGKDRFVTSQIAYGLKYQKIMARLTASSPHVEVGMNIYPEGLLVIHPFLAWHWYF